MRVREPSRFMRRWLVSRDWSEAILGGVEDFGVLVDLLVLVEALAVGLFRFMPPFQG